MKAFLRTMALFLVCLAAVLIHQGIKAWYEAGELLVAMPGPLPQIVEINLLYDHVPCKPPSKHPWLTNEMIAQGITGFEPKPWKK